MVAPVAGGREADLRRLLDSMNIAPGLADPHNKVLPFGDFEQLHFARLVLLDDATMADLEVLGLPRKHLPLTLALLGECDGDGRDFLCELAQRVPAGLRHVFSYCQGFDANTDLPTWLRAHSRPTAASYVNRIGRTVRQIHEEHAVARALAVEVRKAVSEGGSALQRRQLLQGFVEGLLLSGHFKLTPPAATPTGWRLRNLLHATGIPLVALLLLPVWIVLTPIVLILLRLHETRDPEYCPRPDAAAVRAMQHIEDRDLSNSFTAIGPVKPGPFRRAILWVVLLAIDYACRHIFGRGHLARVQSIHFARWTSLDDGARVLFISNYDGSHESYMDDFINKVAWGLNLVFSNGVGWPRTDWLICGGARHELRFKYYQRRHQLPTQVWYKAYVGLTLSDLERHSRIRAGLFGAMNEAQARAWLRLL